MQRYIVTVKKRFLRIMGEEGHSVSFVIAVDGPVSANETAHRMAYAIFPTPTGTLSGDVTVHVAEIIKPPSWLDRLLCR